MNNNFKIGAIIVTYNPNKKLKDLILSLSEISQIVIVDNNSSSKKIYKI